MKDYQQRVVDEKKELDEKLDRLREFFKGETFLALPQDEIERMRWQETLMTGYSSILAERIVHFKD